jgi:hypothetical protein
MARFTVRVELHNADVNDYQRLHAAMAQKGFSRMVTAGDGSSYHMPWPEYDATANMTSMEVLDIARIASNGTGKQNAVLVTEVATRAWIGLSPAA